MFSGYSVNKIAPLKYNLQIRETSIGEYLLYLFIITLNGNDNNMIFYTSLAGFRARGKHVKIMLRVSVLRLIHH